MGSSSTDRLARPPVHSRERFRRVAGGPLPIFECPRCNEMAYSAYAGVPHACSRCGNETLRVIDGAFDEARSAARDLAPGDHALLEYDESDDVAGFCARFLAEGVAAGDRVLAALPGELDGKVRSLLTDQVADGVDWQDSAAIYGDFDADRIANMYDEVIE